MTINQEKLNELPFIEFLKRMRGEAGSLQHVNKSNQAYNEAQEIIMLVAYRFMMEYHWSNEQFKESHAGKILIQSANEIKNYDHKVSEKRKAEMIENFAREYSYDLRNIVSGIEQKPASPTI